MKTTPLHSLHIQLKAKFTEFAGYQMPLQYSSIVEEVM
ncbi:MAG: glycine cleavage system protein T, partial [Thermocrinis sp.]